MTAHDTLPLVVILLATAVVMVVVFRRLHMPAILGYLLVGVLIGPHALGAVPDTPGTRYLAEFGVVFLMFSIGLEFSLPQLISMRKLVLGFGGLQVFISIAIVIGIAMQAGQTWQTGLILGGILAMSSTAIITKVLAEQTQLHSLHGKQIMGVLLFQDLAVIPLLVLIPALALSGEQIAMEIGTALLKAGAVLAVILILGQRIMRPLFHLVAAQKSSELFVLTVLLVTLGLAWATEASGLSLALGAFLAGMLISGFLSGALCLSLLGSGAVGVLPSRRAHLSGCFRFQLCGLPVGGRYAVSRRQRANLFQLGLLRLGGRLQAFRETWFFLRHVLSPLFQGG